MMQEKAKQPPPKAGGGGIRTITPEDEPLVLAHRCNNIESVYNAYFLHGMSKIELDVQMSKDRRIVVYHDDCSNRTVKSLVKDRVGITLYDLLYHIPDNITVNVEIKHYSNNHKHDILTNLVLAQCRKFKYKKFIFSSFDPTICELLRKQRVNVYQLAETNEQLAATFLPNVIVHKSLMHMALSNTKFEKIGVWGVGNDEGQLMMSLDPRVKAVIVDIF